MKKLYLVIITLLSFAACKKESTTCKTCFLIEAEGTPDEVITNLGTKCDGELDDIDGITYISSNGPTRSYCQ